jgi:hypothetical protein
MVNVSDDGDIAQGHMWVRPLWHDPNTLGRETGGDKTAEPCRNKHGTLPGEKPG